MATLNVTASTRLNRILIILSWSIALTTPLLAAWLQIKDFNTTNPYLDLRVYREAIQGWLAGADLYEMKVTEVGLPFTYPPFAVFILIFTALIPPPVLQVLYLLVTATALYLVIFLSFKDIPKRPPTIIICAVAGLLLLSSPIWVTLNFGQINVFLMLLVCLDFFVLHKLKGTLTGVATAIKLTPGIFIIIPLFKRRWQQAAYTIAGFLGATLFGLIVAKEETLKYFLHTLWMTDRVGNPAFSANQSVKGMLTRLEINSTAVWLSCCLILVVMVGYILSRSQNSLVVDLLLVATLGLLISPVSWSHHWVWIALIPAAALALWQTGSRKLTLPLIFLLIVTSVWDPFILQHISDWGATPWYHTFLLSNLYTWAALIVIASFTIHASTNRIRTAHSPHP